MTPEQFGSRFEERIFFAPLFNEVMAELKEDQPAAEAKQADEYKIAATNIQPQSPSAITRHDIIINYRLDGHTLEYLVCLSGEPGMTLKRLRRIIFKHITIKNQHNEHAITA